MKRTVQINGKNDIKITATRYFRYKIKGLCYLKTLTNNTVYLLNNGYFPFAQPRGSARLGAMRTLLTTLHSKYI
ncbi:MAG: hypothetical protein C0620_01005, partial [Desulfuromonas sp.]